MKQKFGKLKILKFKGKDKVKRYDFKRKPVRPYLLMWLIHIVVWFMLLRRKHKVNYVGNKPKGPALIYATHAAFNDFYMLFHAVKTHNINYVTAIDAFYDMSTPLMRLIGAICKRKFISDMNLMRNLKICVDRKTTFVIYPEARYSLDGTTSYLPESNGKLAKFLKVPVYVLNLKGSYISDPQWNKYKQNRMPMEGDLIEVVTKEEVNTLSVKEINERIEKAFVYDDWAYLKSCGNALTYEERATNLNAILYQCPHCKKEFEMEGKGTTLTCNACGKVWDMLENGELKAREGETYFSHVPDWFKWQKQNVHEEVFSGKYSIEEVCETFTLPDSKGFYHHGKGTLIQNSNGTILKVNLYGEEKTIEYSGTSLESVHVEYNYKGYADMLDFSIPGDSIWMRPYRKDFITKVSLATEEIRELQNQNLKK